MSSMPDKEGLLSFLDHLANEQVQNAFGIKRASKRGFEFGVAEGIRQARTAVENWHKVAAVEGYEKHEYKPVFTKPGDPCDVCGFGRNNAVHQ